MLDFFQSRFQTITDYFLSQSFSFSKFPDLFTWDSWTEPNINPTSEHTTLTLLFTVLLMVALTIWRRIVRRKNEEAPVFAWEINQILNVVIFIIIISASYIFFRSQQLPYLSSRLVVLISLVVTLLWIVWISVRLRKTTLNERVSYLEKERFSRYIPKKKARN